MHTILVADQDSETLEMVEQSLQREGYTIIKAQSAWQVISVVEEQTPQMLIMNTTLCGDPIALCRRLRNDPRSSKTPIIFLNAPDSDYTVADVLNAGGDDYLRKPFALRELAARIRAHLRRSAAPTMEIPHLRVVPESLMVYVNDREIMLTPVEFDLLLFLCQQPHHLHTTQDLLTDVWQYPSGAGDTALVRNHIRNLRRKIEPDPDRPIIIQSRHGRGYSIHAHVEIEDYAAQSA